MLKILLKMPKKIRKLNHNLCLHWIINVYKTLAGNYCERVIPDPIPNSEVKPFSADGTLS